LYLIIPAAGMSSFWADEIRRCCRMKPNPIVLIIDADKPTRRLLRLVLEAQRYKVFEAENGEAGTKEAVVRRPDVVILDLCLPDMDGLRVLKQLREWNRAPVFILSGQDDEALKVSALDSGANDYVSKPFGTAEVLARLRVLQRWDPGEPAGPFYINGDLCVDVTARVAKVRNRHIEFTPTEEALFYTLVRHAGQLVTREHLLRCVWGTDSESKVHDLHVYIRSLRQKLQAATDNVLIETEGSTGYKLFVPSAAVVSLPTAQPGLASATA
jgi:two-component system KDP operon response regulator KdpE